MKVSSRLQKRIPEAVATLLLGVDILWWQNWVVFWSLLLVLCIAYLGYRREARRNYTKSAAIRRELTVAAIRALEEKYSARPDFDTPEKRAQVRGPLDRHFYHARYLHAQQLVERYHPGGGRMLDMGCGFGRNTIFMAQRLEGSVIGLELDTLKLAWLRRHLAGADRTCKAALVAADASQPPFRAESFQLVLMAEVLEHLLEPAAALAACYQLLAPGGRLVITTPSRHNLDYRTNPFFIAEKLLSLALERLLPPYHNLHAQFEYNWRRPEPEYGIHYHFSRQQLRRLLEAAGFRTLWCGSFEVELFPYLLIELWAQGELAKITRWVTKLEKLGLRLPGLKHLGQHLLWVAEKK